MTRQVDYSAPQIHQPAGFEQKCLESQNFGSLEAKEEKQDDKDSLMNTLNNATG